MMMLMMIGAYYKTVFNSEQVDFTERTHVAEQQRRRSEKKIVAAKGLRVKPASGVLLGGSESSQKL